MRQGPEILPRRRQARMRLRRQDLLERLRASSGKSSEKSHRSLQVLKTKPMQGPPNWA